MESAKSPPATPKTATAVSSSAADSGADSGGDDALELKGQIDFLNSVIVDMQRKNDDLKAKMELYEAAGIVDTADVADMVRTEHPENVCIPGCVKFLPALA